MNRRALLAAAALGGAVTLVRRAEAHAFPRGASPAVGSTGPAPKTVAITFTEAVEPAFSSITVQDARGARVDTGDLHGDGRKLEIAVRPLPPGTYTVIWHATSVDTHKTEGRFTFTVAP